MGAIEAIKGEATITRYSVVVTESSRKKHMTWGIITLKPFYKFRYSSVSSHKYLSHFIPFKNRPSYDKAQERSTQ